MKEACRQQLFRPGSHGSALSVPSAGCFFGDEVRGSGESCAPSDTDASSEAERPGPDQPVPAESLDSPRNPECSSASGPGTSKTSEHATEGTSLAGQTSGPEPQPSQASTPAELPWTNIDLKEPKKAPGQGTAGLPDTASLCSLGLLPLGLDEPCSTGDHLLWAWVSGGGCAVEAHTVLKWFTVQSGKGECQGPGGAPGRAGSRPPALCSASPSSLLRPAGAIRREGSGRGILSSPCPGSGGHSRLNWVGDIRVNSVGRAHGHFTEIVAS